VYGDHLSLVKRCALGGGTGFVVATLLVPVIGLVAVSGFEDFPDSAFHAGAILFFVLLGIVACVGLAVALRNPVRRLLILAQGGLGFGVAGVLMAAHADTQGIGFIPLAGAIVGSAVASGTPIGLPMGALVGGSTFSLVAVLTSALEGFPVLAGLALFLGIWFWGAAVGATVGSCEEAAARGWSWATVWRISNRPAGAVIALSLLVPGQVTAAVLGPFRNPPGFCFDDEKLPDGTAVLGVADLDGDGDLDAPSRTAGVGGVGLLRNDGAGTLSLEPAVIGSNLSGVAMGDIDGDADIDLVGITIELRKTSFEEHKYSVVVARNDGRGRFTPGPPLALGREATRLVVADLDGDRSADVVIPGRDGSLLLWSRGGRLEPGPRLPEWGGPVLADVNGDGRIDVVTFRTGGIEVHRNTSTASFDASVVAPFGYVSDVSVADLDGDGDPDLLVGSTGTVTLLGNDGGGRFSTIRTLHGGRNNSWVTSGDLDGDGDPDIVASEGPDGEDETTGNVWVWENEGAGQWSDPGRIGSTFERVLAEDMTLDGRVDILVGEITGGRPQWRLQVARGC
jgi:hypothetical protein